MAKNITISLITIFFKYGNKNSTMVIKKTYVLDSLRIIRFAEPCYTCKTWGSRYNHISEISSERSVRALRESSKGGINATFKSLIVKEALDMASFKV